MFTKQKDLLSGSKNTIKIRRRTMGSFEHLVALNIVCYILLFIDYNWGNPLLRRGE